MKMINTNTTIVLEKGDNKQGITLVSYSNPTFPAVRGRRRSDDVKSSVVFFNSPYLFQSIHKQLTENFHYKCFKNL